MVSTGGSAWLIFDEGHQWLWHQTLTQWECHRLIPHCSQTLQFHLSAIPEESQPTLATLQHATVYIRCSHITQMGYGPILASTHKQLTGITALLQYSFAKTWKLQIQVTTKLSPGRDSGGQGNSSQRQLLL